VGGVFADPGALGLMQNKFGGPGLQMQWEFPLALGGVNADQAQKLADDVGRAVATTPLLFGGLGALGAVGLTVTGRVLPAHRRRGAGHRDTGATPPWRHRDAAGKLDRSSARGGPA
jgi:hypothetical protein